MINSAQQRSERGLIWKARHEKFPDSLNAYDGLDFAPFEARLLKNQRPYA